MSNKWLHMKIASLSEQWQNTGIPSRSELEAEARSILERKRAENITGIWENPPLMLTATLDDGMGHGLAMIHLYSEVAGVRVIPLGLLQPVEKIVSGCKKHCPDILGLTVLQFDSEDLIKEISQNIPPGIRIVAGGPVFKADPEFARRAGIHFVAKHVGSFLEFLLDFRKTSPLPG
ncbi:cobalamin B12-binding domain-containing protein [Desulfococcaceae bacterium HSG8]|nr:cobalamin B12-binding domain-containing protein [Desulfococcaceae bacterium HSG8]